MRLSVIGGGRWARVIAAELAAILDGRGTVIIHSRSNASGVADWIETAGLTGLAVETEWPTFGNDRPDGVVVANAAGGHVAAAEHVLANHTPVLVEKPVAPTEADILRLGELARRQGTILAASHVFLFASYVQEFVSLVLAGGPPSEVQAVWTDPAHEKRHGEAKRFDPTISVVDDVISHVLPLVAGLADTSARFDLLDVALDRERVLLHLRAGGVRCRILLARNSGRRRRGLMALREGRRFELRFESDPAVTVIDGLATRSNPGAKRPLETMLRAFVDAVGAAPLHPGLSWQLAATSMALADRIRPVYRAKQDGLVGVSGPLQHAHT